MLLLFRFSETLKLPIKWKSNNWSYWIVTFCNLFRNAENCGRKVLLRQNLICNVIVFQKPRSLCSYTQKNNNADYLIKLRKILETRAKEYDSRLWKVKLCYWCGKKVNRQKHELRVNLNFEWTSLWALLKNKIMIGHYGLYINHLWCPHLRNINKQIKCIEN